MAVAVEKGARVLADGQERKKEIMRRSSKTTASQVVQPFV